MVKRKSQKSIFIKSSIQRGFSFGHILSGEYQKPGADGSHWPLAWRLRLMNCGLRLSLCWRVISISYFFGTITINSIKYSRLAGGRSSPTVWQSLATWAVKILTIVYFCLASGRFRFAVFGPGALATILGRGTADAPMATHRTEGVETRESIFI